MFIKNLTKNTSFHALIFYHEVYVCGAGQGIRPISFSQRGLASVTHACEVTVRAGFLQHCQKFIGEQHTFVLLLSVVQQQAPEGNVESKKMRILL